MGPRISKITVLWAAFAILSLLLAPVHAEPRRATRSAGQFRPEPTGLSLVRPYLPGKTLVVVVHGLWDSPSSWSTMIEGLENDPAIGTRFQFWTFGYSTGNPIPYSAYLLRSELSAVRRRLDPGRTDTAFDRLVLVGHSMGGLLAKMVATDSGDRLWRVVSDRPVGELRGNGQDIKLLRDSLIFRAHPEIRRVIYIATPHQGSRFDQGFVRSIGARFVVLPDALRAVHQRLVAGNAPDFFREPFRNGLPSSIDELGYGSPILTGLLDLAHPPALKVHSIIAVRPDSPRGHWTDGLVSYESAHVAGADSEKLVAAGHFCLDRPEVIDEVRRILVEHASAAEPRGRPVMPSATPALAAVADLFE